MIFQTPKTSTSIREIPLDDETISILKHWRKQQNTRLLRFGQNSLSDDQLLFTTLDNEVLDIDYPNRTLKKLIQDNGLKKITVHSFRHTHCVLLFEAGASIKQVQTRLGHKDSNVTMNIYNHVTKNKSNETASLFANFMAK